MQWRGSQFPIPIFSSSATRRELLISQQHKVQDSKEKVVSMPKDANLISGDQVSMKEAPIEQHAGCFSDLSSTKSKHDPALTPPVHKVIQQDMLGENATCKQPRRHTGTHVQMAKRLQHLLMLTNVEVGRNAAKLTEARTQLETRREKLLGQTSRVSKLDTQIMEMKLELAQCKCRIQQALISKKCRHIDFQSRDASLKMHDELLRKLEQELSKCKRNKAQLDSAEDVLKTQLVEKKQELQLLQEQRSSSILKELQHVQNTIQNLDHEACELRKQLGQQVSVNTKLQAQQAIGAKDAFQTQEHKGQSHLSTVFCRQSSPDVAHLQSMDGPRLLVSSVDNSQKAISCSFSARTGPAPKIVYTPRSAGRRVSSQS